MNKLLLLCILFLASCAQNGNPVSSSNSTDSIRSKTGTGHDTIIFCDAALWEHVYHALRLEVIEKCKTVTGIIYHKKKEKDGDLHILLLLDAGQENLLNQENIVRQKGCLVLEPVCVNMVTQRDAITSCEDFVNHVFIPEAGEHVSVTGSYVLDMEHGWNEIHPVTSIQVIN